MTPPSESPAAAVISVVDDFRTWYTDLEHSDVADVMDAVEALPVDELRCHLFAAVYALRTFTTPSQEIPT